MHSWTLEEGLQTTEEESEIAKELDWLCPHPSLNADKEMPVLCTLVEQGRIRETPNKQDQEEHHRFDGQEQNVNEIVEEQKERRVGNNTEVETGQGNNTEVETGQGNNTEVETGQGNNTEVETGQGTHTEVETGQGTHIEVETDQGNNTEVETGQGNNTEVETGQGNNKEVETGQGTHTETGQGENVIERGGSGKQTGESVETQINQLEEILQEVHVNNEDAEMGLLQGTRLGPCTESNVSPELAENQDQDKTNPEISIYVGAQNDPMSPDFQPTRATSLAIGKLAPATHQSFMLPKQSQTKLWKSFNSNSSGVQNNQTETKAVKVSELKKRFEA